MSFCYTSHLGGMILNEKNTQELERKKRYLKRYKKNLALVARLEDKIKELDHRVCKIKSPVLSDMPKGGTPVTMEDLIADKMEIEERIERLKNRGLKYKREILEQIDEIDDIRHAEILESFFIDCKTFDQIAEENGYTVRHVIRLYSIAISNMSI